MNKKVIVRDTKNAVYNRLKILSLLKKHGSLTISALAKHLGLSRPAVYSHLTFLQKNMGYVYFEKDEKKRGAPVYVKLTGHASPINLDVLEGAYNTWMKFASIFDK